MSVDTAVLTPTGDDELLALLEDSTVIAVVGASTDESKPSNQIPRILMRAGYKVIPIHPKADEILGETAYPTLADVPVQIDIVDVFRPPQEAPGIAEQAVEVGATALWLQMGITSPEAREIATTGGVAFVEDRCIGATTQRLGARPVSAQ